MPCQKDETSSTEGCRWNAIKRLKNTKPQILPQPNKDHGEHMFITQGIVKDKGDEDVTKMDAYTSTETEYGDKNVTIEWHSATRQTKGTLQ